MDIDISDILASVSRPHPQPHSQSHQYLQRPPSHPPTRYAPDSTTHTDHQLLVRAWTSERCCPELLPYPAQLINRVMDHVAAQIARIEELAASGNGDGHEDRDGGGGGGGGGGGVGNINLALSILQTDLSRTQFLVRSLLRVRLAKLGTWAGYYLHLVERGSTSTSTSTSTPGSKSTVPPGAEGDGDGVVAAGLLSTTEAQFLRRRQALLHGFYEGSFLAGFPAKMTRLDEGGTGDGGMLEGPAKDGVVVVRCLGEDGWGNEEDLASGEAQVVNELRMRHGEVWVVRWGDVRRGVVEGGLELL